ncbi:MAG TPA: hypothetical protein VFQ53_10480 [Kofleriaceae bacterium]|nr:hypothetical protein [Kofleriaceae bacterium]
MVGVAAAQPAKTGSAADATKTTAPKTGADATKTPATGKTDPKATTDAKTAGKPELPKPPAELEAMGKMVSGNWRCKGEEFAMDGTKSAVTATNRTKVDLDKWWITDQLEVKGKQTFKMLSYTTYDATAKKWRRVAVDNWGGQMAGTSDGMKDTKVMTWNLDSMGPMGAGMFRDTVDASDPKAGVKFAGEMSTDKGKTWNKVYEMTCKK